VCQFLPFLYLAFPSRPTFLQRLQPSEHPVFAAAAANAMPVGTTFSNQLQQPDKGTLLPAAAQQASGSSSTASKTATTSSTPALSRAAVTEAVASTVQSVLGNSVPSDEPLMSGGW